MPRALGLGLAILLAAILLYASRYNDLIGLPGGDLIRSWLGETILQPFDIVIWAIAAFLFLTAVQSIVDRIKH